MRPSTVSLSAAASSPALPVNLNISPVNIGFGVTLSGGAPNYTVQHTFDDVFDSAVTPVWFNHPTVAALVANADGNYAFPIRAIRLTYNSGAGTAKLTAIQAGLQ